MRFPPTAVRAKHANSEYSAYTELASADTPNFAAPSELAATALDETQVRLDWRDNSDDETRFYVERSTDGGATWSQAADLAINVTSHTIAQLTPGAS